MSSRASNTTPEVPTSRLPVGSSARSTRGALAKARARATRCCSPPESLPGRWPSAGGQAERAEEVAAAGFGGAAGFAGDHLGEDDVLQRGELAQQMVELVDEADGVAADGGARRVGEGAGVAAVDQDGAGVGAFQQAGEVQQGGFAGAGGGDEGDDLAGLQGEMGVLAAR